jgi:peptidoglycan hydrolase FlgJ
MVELGASTNGSAVSVGRSADDPAKVKLAATQFEALLIAQMLKSMRAASSDGWLGAGEDQAGMSMMEMGEECMAEMMAQQGGLGLASMVMRGLEGAADGAGR